MVTTPSVNSGVNTTANSGAASSADRTSLNATFDQFLSMLTTQLKNQDPLDPMDTAQFTNQLVSFTQVEQQLKTNDLLTQVAAASSANQVTMALSYIGLNVDAKATQFDFNPESDTSVRLGYTLPSAASSNTINIIDSDGNVIRTVSGEGAAGTHTYEWDGKDNNGNVVEAGSYKIQVAALDENKSAMVVDTIVPGIVTGVQTGDDGSIQLMVGKYASQLVDLASITQASL